ncbi:MAG TPA: AI-2E family transporter [Ktedonobacterales bacterium]|nr:AI-2E family transporter [Ktedonobacterales bacterium]
MSGDPQQQPSESERPGIRVRRHIHDLRVSIAPRTIWLAIFATVGVIILLMFLNNVLDVLLLLFAAITIAEAMRPAVLWLNRRHIPRWLGVVIIYLLGFAILAGLGYFISQPLVSQIRQLIDNFPQYSKQIVNWVKQAQGAMSGLPGGNALPQELTNLLGSLTPYLLSIPATIITIIANIVITLFMALFWMAYTDGLREFVLSLFPPHMRPTGARVLNEMSIRLGGYVRGIIINMFVIGILSGMAVWLLGLPYALLLGVFAGLTEAIPLVGPFIGATPAVIIGFTISPVRGLLVAGVYVLIQEFEGHTLVPLVMNRVVRLRPLTILVALSIGTLLKGLEGALLAVPFAAVVQVLILYVLAPWIRSVTGGSAHHTTEEEARPPTQSRQENEARLRADLHDAEQSAVEQKQAEEAEHRDGEVGSRR